MDAKSIGIGVVAVAALAVAVSDKLTEKDAKELTVVAGGTVADEAVTAIAQVGKDVDERVCELQRVGTLDGIVLKWACNGAVLPEVVQAELDKMAGPDGSSITLKPRLDGEKVIYDATVTRGVKPNLDPVPEPPKAEEPKEEPVGEGEEAVGP